MLVLMVFGFLDAGIQYRTGEEDELKFGISFKNWGPRMSFSGRWSII